MSSADKMNVEFSEDAEASLDRMDEQLRILFFNHVEKISNIPPRRHMKFGLPYNVEKVTKKARMVYQINDGILYVLRCFQTHKEYERWYKSFM
jgi:mRNA-degrading endonuclease RelE of RelBE toxin-antitoxin system